MLLYIYIYTSTSLIKTKDYIKWLKTRLRLVIIYSHLILLKLLVSCCGQPVVAKTG